MFCQNCGSQLPDDARFCRECGAPTAALSPAAPAQPAPSPVAVVPTAGPEDDAIFSLPLGVMTTLPSARGKRSNIVVAPRGDTLRAVAAFESVLSTAGFKRTDYRGEPIWKKGVGAMTAMQYVRLRTRGDLIGVSAWVMMGLGSADIHEMPLTGFVAGIPKKSLESTVKAGINAVEACA